MTDRQPPELIYILGFPFSGSSLLALGLGNSPGVTNGGEINFITNDFHPARRCSCGAGLYECAYWRDLRARLERDAARGLPALSLTEEEKLHPIDARRQSLWVRIGPLLGLPLSSLYGEAALRQYAAEHVACFHHVADQSGAEVVVDASKNPRRLNILREYGGVQPYVIAIKKAPEFGFGARIKRARRRNRFYVQALSPFYLARYLYTETMLRRALRALPADRVFETTYEDFVGDPQALQQRLSAWLGRPIDFGIDADGHMTVQPQHVFTGNAWMIKRTDLSDGVDIRPPAQRAELTVVERGLFRAVAAFIPALRAGS